MVQLTYLNLNRAKRLSYFDLNDLYGLKFFNHKNRKALRKAKEEESQQRFTKLIILMQLNFLMVLLT
jgi:hypothetical protein